MNMDKRDIILLSYKMSSEMLLPLKDMENIVDRAISLNIIDEENHKLGETLDSLLDLYTLENLEFNYNQELNSKLYNRTFSNYDKKNKKMYFITYSHNNNELLRNEVVNAFLKRINQYVANKNISDEELLVKEIPDPKFWSVFNRYQYITDSLDGVSNCGTKLRSIRVMNDFDLDEGSFRFDDYVTDDVENCRAVVLKSLDEKNKKVPEDIFKKVLNHLKYSTADYIYADDVSEEILNSFRESAKTRSIEIVKDNKTKKLGKIQWSQEQVEDLMLRNTMQKAILASQKLILNKTTTSEETLGDFLNANKIKITRFTTF